jgi:hypothetical protein
MALAQRQRVFFANIIAPLLRIRSISLRYELRRYLGAKFVVHRRAYAAKSLFTCQCMKAQISLKRSTAFG